MALGNSFSKAWMRNDLLIQKHVVSYDSQMALCHHPRPRVEAPRKYCLFPSSSQCHCHSHLSANWPDPKQLASDPGSQQMLDPKLSPVSLTAPAPWSCPLLSTLLLSLEITGCSGNAN